MRAALIGCLLAVAGCDLSFGTHEAYGCNPTADDCPKLGAGWVCSPLNRQCIFGAGSSTTVGTTSATSGTTSGATTGATGTTGGTVSGTTTSGAATTSTTSGSTTGASVFPPRPDAGGLLEQGALCNYFVEGIPESCSTQTTYAFLGYVTDGGCAQLKFNGGSPDMVAYDSAGALWVDALGSSNSHAVWRLTPNGGVPSGPLTVFSPTSGNGDVPVAITAGPPGELIVAGSSGDFVQVLMDGGTATIGGLGLPICSSPDSLAFDPSGPSGPTVYLVDSSCPNVEQAPFPVGPWTNIYPTSAGDGLSNPFGLTAFDGNVYVTDTQYSQVFRLTDAGPVSVAGVAAYGNFQDGPSCANDDSCPGTCATLCSPQALAVGRGDSLVFLDEQVLSLRAIDLDAGFVQTIVGIPNCSCTASSNHGKDTGCTSNQPFTLNFSLDGPPKGSALTVDGLDGDVFLAWPGGNAVVVIEANL